jgi:hypothetical protein
MGRRIPPGLVFVGHQQMTLDDSTAVSLTSTIRASVPSALLFSVETNNVRLGWNSTTPTLNTGVVFVKDNEYFLENYSLDENMKFQRTTGTAVIQALAFKRAGQ